MPAGRLRFQEGRRFRGLGAVWACGVRPVAAGGKQKGLGGGVQSCGRLRMPAGGQDAAGPGLLGGQPEQTAVDDLFGDSELAAADDAAGGEPPRGLPAVCWVHR